jgi:hypothetical protein
MSIRFVCPKCGQNYTVNDRDAGKKSDCKMCGQRLQVPALKARTKTVIGELVPPPLARPSFAEPSQPDHEPTPTLRARRQLPAGLLAFGIVGAVFLIVILGIVAVLVIGGGKNGAGDTPDVLSGLGKPSQQREGKAWEFIDLVNYLKKNGYPELVTEQGETPNGWTLIVKPPPEVEPKYNRNGAEMTKRVEVQDMGVGFDAAKFNRNLTDDQRGGNWGWGRFAFFARHPLILAKLRKVLEK